MNRVRAIDRANLTLTADAGCVLQSLQIAADEAGLLFPLSLAAEGSCTIGGNLATNAGGTQVLRYGNARELCLGLELVTAAGEVWDGLSGLRKDNTGYDLRDLMIGSEGTLGIITAATLKLFPKPAASLTALASCATLPDAVALLGLAQARVGAGLTGFEIMGEFASSLVRRHFGSLPQPLPPAPWTVLLECADAEGLAQARTRFESLLEAALERDHLIPQASGLLELEPSGGLSHATSKRLDEGLAAALEEEHHRLDVLVVPLGRDGVHARRRAPADLVQETRAAPVFQHVIGAGAQLEEAVHHPQGLANGAGRGVRPEVARPVLPWPADRLEPRVGVRAIEPQAEEVLVVPELDVEARAVLLDELVLEEERLLLGRDDDRLEVKEQPIEQRDEGPGVRAACLEVALDAVREIDRLAHVEHAALAVLHQVHAGPVRQPFELLRELHGRHGDLQSNDYPESRESGGFSPGSLRRASTYASVTPVWPPCA